jgi:uncharacterized protein (TIGR02646 family)
MRPIHRGPSPQATDFANYRDAFPELVARMGPFCSYCERRMPTNLAVEHIQPKDPTMYPHLIGRWENYVLGCVNCNGTKTNKDVLLDRTFIVDRDNTFYAFVYTPDGKVAARQGLSVVQTQIANDTLALAGLEKPINEVYDENGQLVAIDRVGQRMQVWMLAEESKRDLATLPDDMMRRQVSRTAVASGFFSIWMTVFEDDPVMRQMFIADFPGTATDCFDVSTTAVTPRPDNGLAFAGKV